MATVLKEKPKQILNVQTCKTTTCTLIFNNKNFVKILLCQTKFYWNIYFFLPLHWWARGLISTLKQFLLLTTTLTLLKLCIPSTFMYNTLTEIRCN